MGLEVWHMPPSLFCIYRDVEVGVKDVSLCGVPDGSSPISQSPGGEG